MLTQLVNKLENPERPLLGPNYSALKFWGLLLPQYGFKKYFYLLMHLLVTVFTATECVDIWFVKGDMNLLLNNLKITLLATMSVWKVSSFLSWQQDWEAIIDYVTNADVVQRNSSNSKKLDIINKYTKYCRNITYIYWSLMYTTVAIVTLTPVFKFILSPTYRENTKNGTEDYLQVVSSWVPFDKSTFIGYLGASLYQTYAAVYGGGWITSYDTNAIVLMIFFRGELEMLRNDSADIYGNEMHLAEEDVAQERLKDFHRRHIELVKYAKLFDSCLSPIMLLYMIVCSVMLCVTAYQITNETSAMQRFLTTEYLIFCIAQLFIYCWHSNDVLYTSQELMLGPYESAWWAVDAKRRKDLYILTEQFRTVVVFSVGPFSYLTVPTFISIFKGAYSYYTLLSKSQIN